MRTYEEHICKSARDESKGGEMVYRKGERPVVKEVAPYTPEHPVARWIADGDSWVMAWVGQMTTPWPVISRKTGIPMERIEELDDGEEPTDEEVEKLAALWWTTPTGLRKSIDDARPAMEARRKRLASIMKGE